MTEPTPPARLDPAVAATLAAFARTCKAAARAVSLYPAAHPAIGVALQRLTETGARATANGALTLQIRAESIRIDGAMPERPDPAIGELAALLHRHQIGELVLRGGTDADSWRTLLQLLAREPEETRAEGGIAQLWARSGGPSIEILEVDYADVMRDRLSGDAAIDDVIEACLRADPLAEWDDVTLEALRAVLSDPQHVADLIARLEERVAGRSTEAKSEAFLRLLRRIAAQLEATSGQADTVFAQLAQAAAGLSADTLAGILSQLDSPEAMAGGINVVAAVADRVTDESIVGFVARTVIAERSPTARLAEAFQALVPEIDRRRQLLALAGERVAESPLAEEVSFESLWSRVEGMLTSYTDTKYVSADYAQELSAVRATAIDIERVSDDPPERINAWLTTVNDGALRQLDVQLLLDLLRVEGRPPRWRDVADTVVTHLEELARVGLVEQACVLGDAVAAEATAPGDAPRKAHAQRALERLGTGTLIGSVAGQLRGIDDATADKLARLCYAVGPGIIPAMADALAAEQDARARRRLLDILVGFGPRGQESIQRLLEAPNWEVRRTAAFLLREFGNTESLAALEPLLRDAEPLVQREAIRGIVLSGSEAAFELLRRVLATAPAGERATLVHELAVLRDARATPLFCHLVRHLDRGALRHAYEVSLDALGSAGDQDAIDVLAHALDQGEWWAPLRTRALKARAAAALRRVGTPAALEALRQAAERGSGSTRRAARAALTQTKGA